MQIRLSKRGPVMWFLGDPKQLIVSLSISSPVAEIDFDSLDSGQQLKVLNDLQKGIIKCDEGYQAVYNRWNATNTVDIQEQKDTSPQNEMLRMQIEAKKHIQEKRQQLLNKRDKEIKRQNAICETLTNSSYKAIRNSLKNEKNISFLKMFLQAERTNKNRDTIIKYVENKILRESIASQKAISKKVNKAVKKQLKQTPQKETTNMRVVESEQETVVLTPEDLIAAANE